MNPIFENINLSRRKKHLLFWTIWVFSFTFIKSIGSPMLAYFDWLLYYLFTLPIFVAHTYLLAYWLFPYFFIKRQYTVFALLFLILLYAFSIAELILSNEFIFKYLCLSIPPERGYLTFKNITISGIGNLYVVVLFVSVKSFKNWYTSENEKNALIQQTVEAEILLLKNQLQPRFLLNTINFLEQMALVSSAKTPDMVIRISNLLGNIYHDSSEEMVSLRKEINLIESYVDIQRLIHEEKMKIEIIRTGDLGAVKVPALSMFSMIEQIIELSEKCDQLTRLELFVQAQSNRLLLKTSLIGKLKESAHELIEIAEKTQKRLQYYYESACRVTDSLADDSVNLIIEIDYHDKI